MHSQRRWFGLALLFVALVWQAAPRAQDPRLAREHAGRVIVKPLKFPVEIAADERPHITAWFNQLVEIMRRMPTLAQPRGFDVSIEARIEWHDLDGQLDTKRPTYVGGVVFAALSAYENGPKGTTPNEGGRLATLQIAVNDLSAVAGQEGMHGVSQDDAGVQFHVDPPGPSETRHGLPTYASDGDPKAWVLMTRSTAPVFVPVTHDHYLRYWIAETQSKAGRPLATLAPPPSNDPAVIAAWQEAQRRMAAVEQTFNDAKATLQQQLDGLNKQLAAMSATDRAAPVYAANVGPSESGQIAFLRQGDRDAQPVVSINPALMNDRLPRWTPQTLAVGISTNEHWTELADRLDQELDWDALKKLLQ